MRSTDAAPLSTFYVRRFEIMKRIFIFAASVGLSAALTSIAFAEGQNVFGETAPNQNVVQPENSRGQLGGLASGAPSFASNLKDLRGPGNAVAAQAIQQPAAGIAQTQTAVQGQTIAVEKQSITPIQSFHQLAIVRHHCFLHSRPNLPTNTGPLGPAFVGSPFTPAIVRTPGDLEIAGIGMIADASPQQGPLYRVTIRNNSETPSRHFEISLIAIRGQINHTSPVVTAHINEIAAGGVHEIDVQLPIGVMSLGLANQAAPFESLVVAIDSFDQLIETNELNNVAILTRGEIALIETAAATTTTTVTAPAAAPAPSVVAPVDAAPGTAAPAPGTTDAPAPGDTTVTAPAQPSVAPQAPATGSSAPAESTPPASSNGSDNDLESLVPQNGGK
jgi:hypothetical protein